MAAGRLEARPDVRETEKDKDLQKLTCPCRSVLSSMRAQVNVWAPSDATDNTESGGQRGQPAFTKSAIIPSLCIEK